MNYNVVTSTNLTPACVLEVLKTHSDAKHPLTQKKIAELVCNEFSMDKESERKAIGNAVNRLSDEMGYDIVPVGNKGCYFNGSFSENELKFLTDLVRDCTSIDEKQADSLIDRIGDLGSVYQKRAVKCSSVTNERHGLNHSVFYNMETGMEAVKNCSTVSFDVYAYGVNGFSKRGRSSMIPRDMEMVNGRYFLNGIDAENDNDVSYPLDRISNMKCERGGGMGVRPLRKVNPERFVIALDDEDLIDDLVLRFGCDDYTAVRSSTGEITINFMADYREVVNWLLINADRAEVLKPEKARTEIINKTCACNERYCA